MDKKMTGLLSRIYKKVICASLLTLALALFISSATAFAEKNDNIPAKGTVTMIDLGAKSCIPCKLMAPIMEKMEKKYAGKAVIHFYDVWEDREPAVRFGVRMIPTQIFFNREAKEVYRHEGFMSEADIEGQLSKMDVK